MFVNGADRKRDIVSEKTESVGRFLGSLWVILLVAVQLVWVIRGHVGEILEDVLVSFIP